ncbi:hypothetical protein Lbir_1690 [Legionella birminghamensis]|uniref:Uncharacterized protein n=1 Tax=Legionella birminghamensis TaxID=28083 RepID=A0A378IF44_9GAMM|nr:hypothetical protein [Legionella birminghamensis]KTC71538.1 hypothetical protein Lbir_1690 [Legionella birminghamensis]STX30854.1 Uncharacterised protein [Legionella birminghamensis]
MSKKNHSDNSHKVTDTELEKISGGRVPWRIPEPDTGPSYYISPKVEKSNSKNKKGKK